MRLIPRQQIKKRIKKYLENLPYGFGVRVLIPPARFVLVLRRLYILYKKINGEEKEARRILHALRNGKIKKTLVVYDNLVSPPTYGDFLCAVMLARYFTSQDIVTSFVIVDGDYRENWSVLNEAEKKQRVVDYTQIANLLLDPVLATVEVLSWPQLQARIQDSGDSSLDIPFCGKVLTRARVYSHTFNALCHLCSKSSQDHLDRFSLSFEELAGKVAFKKPEQPYITWACRYSMKWGFGRNMNDRDFLQIYSRLKSLYPRHAIMVVSDKVGCNHFREIANQHGLPCLFSKDYSETFMGDGALVLGSSFYYQDRGGGIDIVPIFSALPYEIRTPMGMGNVAEWQKDVVTSWANDQQVLVNTTPSLTMLRIWKMKNRFNYQSI